MPLSDLKLKKIYRTKQDNITDVLIIPALNESKVYDRVTGYFIIDSLAGLADGLKEFYNDCAQEVIEFCERHEIQYHIKDGTMTGG